MSRTTWKTTDTYTHVHTYTTHVHMYTHMHTHVRAYTHIHTHTHTYTHSYTHIQITAIPQCRRQLHMTRECLKLPPVSDVRRSSLNVHVNTHVHITCPSYLQPCTSVHVRYTYLGYCSYMWLHPTEKALQTVSSNKL